MKNEEFVKMSKKISKSIYRVLRDPNLTLEQKVNYLEKVDKFIDKLELGKE